MLDEAANNLLKFNERIDAKKHRKPASLNIVTGAGRNKFHTT
jgi:hypothetical protein